MFAFRSVQVVTNVLQELAMFLTLLGPRIWGSYRWGEDTDEVLTF